MPRRLRILTCSVALLAAAACVQIEHGGTTGADTAVEVRHADAASASLGERAAEQTTAPRHDLATDEAMGGHTLARHVGRTDADLGARLNAEPSIGAASTYTDRATAERVVAATLAANERRIATWRARSGTRPNLALDFRGTPGDVIGRTIVRGRPTPIPSTNAIVVLCWSDRRGDAYVLTSYPEAR